jgi:hypothetical protein
MPNLVKRVRKLEARWTDRTGLVPHSPEWFDYWGEKLDRIEAGEDVDLTGFSLDVTDAFIAAADAEMVTR